MLCDISKVEAGLDAGAGTEVQVLHLVPYTRSGAAPRRVLVHKKTFPQRLRMCINAAAAANSWQILVVSALTYLLSLRRVMSGLPSQMKCLRDSMPESHSAVSAAAS